MNDAPVISVVMPVRNEERFVAAAIASVLRQSHQDLEVLVIDGCSQDDTREVVSEIADVHPRVRLLSNPAGTIPAGLNVGLMAARGAYVARVDAHARINDAYLETALQELETGPDVAAVGGQRIGVAETPTGTAVAAALSSPFGVGNSVNHYATRPLDTDHASFGMYRREVLDDVGGWDERLLVNEDVDIDYRILARGYRIRYNPDMHIYWQVRETVPHLARQYRRYGRGKAAMVRKNGRQAVLPRHLAAPALVVWLSASPLLALTGRRRAAAAMGLPYVLGVAAASVVTTRGTGSAPSVTSAGAAPQHRVRTRALPAVFAAMHLGWGLGFLEGLLLGLEPVASSAPPPKATPSSRGG